MVNIHQTHQPNKNRRALSLVIKIPVPKSVDEKLVSRRLLCLNVVHQR